MPAYSEAAGNRTQTMEYLDKLESCINTLINENKKLREERIGVSQDTDNVQEDLKEAKKTIKELQLNIENVGKPSQRQDGLEAKKKEIIAYIRFILSKLDQLNNINITNDQG
ncbi:hypothetical protein ACFL1R_02965 [Candidatus Latescibacterota bacterium]